ncbi:MULTISPECIES: hypothetical protein [Rhizobium]|nr:MULTISPECIES: hypothetical protein [Rhizobium]
MAVITAAGIEGSDADLTQLLQAIQALIAAATGSADTSNYVLMPAARARLPIFPEVLTSDGRIPVSAPSTGTVRVPAGYDFLHRGIFAITTVQTDFVTVSNKTYHLRWRPTDGFQLKDLADAAYNPAALAETDLGFDSQYDDMLVARVVTTAGNTATIANLANKVRLELTNVKSTWSEGPSGMPAAQQVAINFARTPQLRFTGASVEVTSTDQEEIVGWGNQEARNRYTAKPYIYGTRVGGPYINGYHTVVFEA